MDQTAWLEERRKGLGSSDAAAVCGLSPYRTPLHVYLDKLGLAEYPETDAMRWGLKLEDVIATAYVEATDNPLQVPKPAILTHPALEWMKATPDRIAVDRLVELKTSRTHDQWGREGTDEIPEGYLLQVQHQMAVVGIDLCDVAVLIGGSDFRVYTVPANHALQERLIAIEEDFWRRVEERRAPALDWNDPRTPKLVEALYRPIEGQEIDLDAHALSRLDRYEQLGIALRELQDERDEIRARVVESMGPASVGHLPDGRMVARNTIHRKAYSIEAGSYVDFRIKKRRKAI